MIELLYYSLILLIYLFFSFLLIRFLKNKLAFKSDRSKTLSLTILYALLFGFGFIGSRTDPGFAFPAPITICLIASIYFANLSGLIFNLSITLFWMLLIFFWNYYNKE